MSLDSDVSLQSPAGDPKSIQPKKLKKRRPLWLRLFRIAALVYLGIFLIGMGFQTALVFPGKHLQGTAEAMAKAYPQMGINLIALRTAEGQRLGAVWMDALSPRGQSSAPADRYAVLWFYGNGSCANYELDRSSWMRKLGCDVLVTDYVGYGMSEGKPTEAGCYATADAAYAYATEVRHVRPERLIVVGQSLGGGVAIDLASRKPVAGLITISAFTTIRDMGRHYFPWLPTSLLVRSRFDNLTKIAQVNVPTLIIHGDADQVVPCSMAPRLAGVCKRLYRRLEIPGGGHNDLWEKGATEIVEATTHFLAALRMRSEPELTKDK